MEMIKVGLTVIGEDTIDIDEKELITKQHPTVIYGNVGERLFSAPFRIYYHPQTQSAYIKWEDYERKLT